MPLFFFLMPIKNAPVLFKIINKTSKIMQSLVDFSIDQQAGIRLLHTVVGRKDVIYYIIINYFVRRRSKSISIQISQWQLLLDDFALKSTPGSWYQTIDSTFNYQLWSTLDLFTLCRQINLLNSIMILIFESIYLFLFTVNKSFLAKKISQTIYFFI